MKPFSTPVLMAVMSALASMSVVSSLRAQEREITVTVTVETEQGQAIANAPVQVITMNGIAFDLTDTNGQFVAALDADEAENVLAARLSNGRWHDLSDTMRFTAQERYDELRNLYSFATKFLVTLQAGVDTYAVTLVARPAITVQGRLVDDQANPVTGSVAAIRTTSFDEVWDSDFGGFAFGGVEQGAQTYVVASREDSAEAVIVHLTAQQTLADIDLGDIVVPPRGGDALVDLEMTNQVGLHDSQFTSLGFAATLISEDGLRVYQFPVTIDGAVVRRRLGERVPEVEAGVYYIVPGAFGTRSSMALYLSILAGRQAQLDAAGVPRVTAVSDQQVELQFDATAAYDAVISVGGDLW